MQTITITATITNTLPTPTKNFPRGIMAVSWDNNSAYTHYIPGTHVGDTLEITLTQNR